MRAKRRGRNGKLNHLNQRSAPIGDRRHDFHGHRQRLLRQVLAYQAAVTVIVLPSWAGRLRSVVIVTAGLRSVAMIAMTVPAVTVIVPAVIVPAVILANRNRCAAGPAVAMLMKVRMKIGRASCRERV